MKNSLSTTLATVLGAAALLAAAGPANAGGHVNWSIGIGTGFGGYYPSYPPPVVYSEPRVVYGPPPVSYAPPPVVYSAPPVVYQQPVPVYRVVPPAVVYYGYGGRRWYGDGHYRGHRDHDRHDRHDRGNREHRGRHN